MKRLLRLLGTSVGSALLLVTSVQAQQEAPAPTPVIEIFPCTFRGSSDMDDLRAVTTRFNAWADRNNVTNYGAFTMTPYLYSPDTDSDVLWIGGWPNGTAMGANEALWLAEGGEVAAAFDAVVECNAHSLYAEVIINQPSAPPPQNGVAMFEDCKVHDGRTVEEALAALGQWSEYVKSRGGDEFSAALFPLAGLPNDADYDFKIVTGFASIQAFGQGTDMYTGGGYLRGEELFSRLLDCNSARVYTLDRVRLAAPPPAR